MKTMPESIRLVVDETLRDGGVWLLQGRKVVADLLYDHDSKSDTCRAIQLGRLFATAPNLLEACKAMATIEDIVDVKAARALAEAAIAKAEPERNAT